MSDLYAQSQTHPLPAAPGRGATVSLRPVTSSNVRAMCDLRTTPEQRSLVGPAAYTVAESAYEPDGTLTAIYADDVPVGIGYVDTESDTPYLVRFMIDAGAQARGFGAAAVELLCERLRAEAWSALEVTFVPKVGGAQGFWERLGFTDTGRTRDGEPIYVRAL